MALIMTIMIFFVVVNLIIGFWSARKVTTDGFIRGERKMTLWIIVFSTFTTSIGAGDIFSYPSLGYLQGWSSLHYVWAMPVVVIIMAFTVGKRYYDMNAKTISDVLAKVYGENTKLRILSSVCMAAGLVAWTATQYSAFGRTLSMLTNFPPVVGMFIGAIIFISYTVAGGLVSVAAVSIIQGILMIAGIILIFFATQAAGGGYTAVQAAIPASYKTFLGPVGAVTITMFWMNKGLSRFTNFTYWQRLGAAKNSRTGIWGVSLGMATTAVLGLFLVIIGMNAAVATPGMADPEMVFADSTVRYFPKWVAGLMLGALWAAILSSAGGFLNAASTLIGHDVWFKALKKENADDKIQLRHLKIITAVIGLITFFAAWATPSALKLTLWAGVWLTPPLIPVLGATLFDRKGERIDINWLFISMLCSCIMGVVFEVHPVLKNYFSGGTIPAFIVSAALYTAGLIVRGRQKRNAMTAAA